MFVSKIWIYVFASAFNYLASAEYVYHFKHKHKTQYIVPEANAISRGECVNEHGKRFTPNAVVTDWCKIGKSVNESVAVNDINE